MSQKYYTVAISTAFFVVALIFKDRPAPPIWLQFILAACAIAHVINLIVMTVEAPIR